MDDLGERLRALDGLEAPDLRPRLGTRSLKPPAGRSSRRVAIAAVALVVAAVAVGAVYVAFRGTARPAVPSIVPALRANGLIWFLGDEGGGAGSVFGPSGVYSVAPNGTDLSRVPLSKRLYSITGLTVSPNGELVALSNGGGEFPPRNLSVMRSDGSDLRQITRDSFYDVSPSWAPDGSQIVFASTRCCATEHSSGNYALYTIRPDGSGLRRLTEDSASDLWPQWSPDGSRIAYIRMPDRGGWQIWVMNADGSGARQLTHDDRFNEALAWSPDGLELAYVTALSDGRDWEIRVMRPDGSDTHTVYTCAAPCVHGAYSLAWSPDGTQIAFTFGGPQGYAENQRIAVIGADGSGFHVVDTHGVGACCLSWIPATG